MKEIFTEKECMVEPVNELLEGELSKLSESIKTKLVELSKTANIDMNTLWIAFKSSMQGLENDFKVEYL